jgi:hypothetical protein
MCLNIHGEAAMVVMVNMPNGADEGVVPQTILVIRKALPFERRENPLVRTTIWMGRARLYPSEELEALADKFGHLVKLAKLTAPNGMKLLLNMAQVTDVDDPTDSEAASTRSVLRFGSGVGAPRQSVREDRSNLETIWAEAGVNTDIFRGV